MHRSLNGAPGEPSFRVEPMALSRGEPVVEQAIAFAKQHAGQPVLIYATSSPDEVKAVQKELGVEKAGHLVEEALASIARGLRDLGVRKFVVAGGETSGAVCRRSTSSAAHRTADRSRRARDAIHRRKQRRSAARARAQVGQFRHDGFLREGAEIARRSRVTMKLATTNDENRIREEICVTGASLYQRGYTVGSAGNISARLDDGWLITPTDVCLGRLDPAEIAKVDARAITSRAAGRRRRWRCIARIYENNADAHGVIHTHSTHLVALTLAGVWRDTDVLPPITPYYVMKVGHVPLIRYRRPGDPAVAEEVAALASKVRGVLLERLGPVVWERSVSQASYALEELEETARLWLMTTPRPEPLEEAAIEDLRATFNARW